MNPIVTRSLPRVMMIRRGSETSRSLSRAGPLFPPASCSLIGAASGGPIVEFLRVPARIWMRRVPAHHVLRCALVGVLAVVKQVFGRCLHVLTRRRGAFVNERNSFGELRNV